MQNEVGDEHLNFHIRHVWTSMHSSGMKLSWERSLPALSKEALEPFSKRVKLFGNMGPCSIPKLVDPVDIFDKKGSSFADVGLRVMKQTDETFWEQQISFDRKAAYKKWTALILGDPGSWSVARPKPGDALTEFLQQGLDESIKDALGIKATSTLHGRANPLVRYVQFARDNSIEPFPIKEALVYRFLKDSDTAPTSPRSFITSASFAKHVLGLMQADEVLSSGHVKGYMAVHFAKKRRLVQRPPLTVKKIEHLEMCVKDENRTMYDRIASGFFLLLVFGRLRFSDGQSMSSMKLEVPIGLDKGYLECAAERCKTATTLGKRTRLLPVVVTTLSFTDVRVMEEMITQINASNFEPDASRGGCFPAGVPAAHEGKDQESSSSPCDSKGDEHFEHSADERYLGESCREMGWRDI